MWLNDRRGCLVDRTAAWVPQPSRRVAGVELADFDEDGDLDVLVARACAPIGCGDVILVNRTRQLGLPWLPRIGRRFALDFAAEPGTAVWFHVAIPLLVPRRAPTPLPPFGRLGPRSDAMLQLDPVYIPAGRGSARSYLDVPNDPSLVGASVHAQAVLLSPIETHLTSVARTLIID